MLFGFGRMGSAAYYFLKKCGYKVLIVELKGSGAIWNPQISDEDIFIESESGSHFEYLITIYAPDLVVSTLPYTKNVELAAICLKQATSYVDLGGKVENTEQIKEMTTGTRDVAVFTDLGLAPGLINILTEDLIRRYTPKQVTSITCAVGGIPVSDSDSPFSYVNTWSIEGLINEYLDQCTVLSHGHIGKREGMYGLEHILFTRLGHKLEMFYTSGGAAHSIEKIKDLGFQNFCYKTLRYIGHRNFVKPILDMDAKNASSIISRLSQTAPEKNDMVVGLVNFRDKDDEDVIRHEFIIHKQKDLTAMQVATAAPLVAVASMVADGYLPRQYLTYTDVVRHMPYFKWKLREFGVSI